MSESDDDEWPDWTIPVEELSEYDLYERHLICEDSEIQKTIRIELENRNMQIIKQEESDNAEESISN